VGGRQSENNLEYFMNKPSEQSTNESKPRGSSTGKTSIFGIIFWPIIKVWSGLDKHFVSYITGRVRKDSKRIYAVRFVWYNDSVYLHPMIWGGMILSMMAKAPWPADGWVLLSWFILLFICFLTIMYNFDVIKTAILGVGVVAVLGLSYIASMKFSWSPLTSAFHHVEWLEAQVSPGFYMLSSYIFAIMISSEIIWAWLFHRVEIDESYVYEHRFLRGTEREPIFARGLKRETKDLLELLLLGAADISHRTRNGFKCFKNVPFASLWLGMAIDSMLDYRRRGEEELGKGNSDESDQARIDDAMHGGEEDDGGGDDGGGDDGGDGNDGL
jgi:uncharacterized membrane protein YgcG